MSAGIVTSDDNDFTNMIRDSSADMRELATATRALIFDLLTDTVEVVWPHQRTAGYGTGPKKKSQQFCWITPSTHHITLGFYYGAELSDAHQLLEGTGKSMRHVKLRRIDNLQAPGLRDLITEAITHLVHQSPR